MRLEYLAAFIATWLCLYCIPINTGDFIRPEVFTAAVSIAKGTRRAIGVASLAHLYRCLDDIHHSIATGTGSASEHKLPLPAHFIMGWFAVYWRAMPTSSTSSTNLTKNPPFIVDTWRAHYPKIDLVGAHNIFLDVDEQQHGLLSLDFLGRLGLSRFPKAESVHLNDCRETSEEERTLKISEIDILISSIVGGLFYRRCQQQINQVYCPHRFARAHNCDQEVPDFLMDGLLQFSEILQGTTEETTELLTRRLLGHLRPGGHSFKLLPRTRTTQRSYEYIRWCVSALSFLKEADIFCNGIDIPRPIKSTSATSVSVILESPNDVGTSTPSALEEATNDAAAPVTARKPALVIPSNTGSPVEAPAEIAPDALASQAKISSPSSGDQGNQSTKEVVTEAVVAAIPCEEVLVNAKGNTSSSKTTAKSSKSAKKASSEALAKGALAVETKTSSKSARAQRHKDTNSTSGATAKESLAPSTDVDVSDLETRKPSDGDNPKEDCSGDKHGAPILPGSGVKRKSDSTQGSTSNTGSERRQKLKGPVVWDATESTDQVAAVKDNIEQGVLKFVGDFGTAFDASELPPAPKKLNCKPGAPLQLPESACANTKFAFQQIMTGLKNLQLLASAEKFDQQVFIREMKSALDGWEGFFSSYFTPEIQKMVTRLRTLQEQLEDKSDQQPRDTFESLPARTQRVAEMLEQAASVRRQITEARTKLEHVRAEGLKDQDSVLALEADHTKSIKELEAQLAEKKESLKLVKAMKSKNANFFEEVEIATQVVEESSSRFEEVAAKGDSMSKRLAKYSKKVEEVDGLPPPVHALRSIIGSYSIIE